MMTEGRKDGGMRNEQDVGRASTERGSAPAVGERLTAEQRHAFANQSSDYLREYIRHADQKSIFFFSICSALLAFEHAQNWATRWIKTDPLTAWDLTTGAAMSLLAIAGACFLWVVKPRLGGSKRGIIFFMAVAEFATADEYIETVATRSDSDVATETLRHCYDLAKVAAAKYQVMAIGQVVGGLALALSLLLLVATPAQPSPSTSHEAPSSTVTQRSR
jgi:hypothetical protein